MGYMDTDWVGYATDRKSTGGHLFFYGSGSGRKEETVAVSSTEAEHKSAAEEQRQLKWILQLMQDFGPEESKPVQLFEDNQGCIQLAQEEEIHSRTKHTDMKYHL